MQSILSYDGSTYLSPRTTAHSETFRPQYCVVTKDETLHGFI